MAIEYCETCDKNIDTDYNEGVYVVTRKAKLYGDDPHPEETEFMCQDCHDIKLDDHESREAAEEDHGRAKARGEL